MADDIAAWHADVVRRLRALETSPRAIKTSLRGGRIRFLPTTPTIDQPSLTIGAGSGDDAGIAMFDSAGNQYYGVGSFSGTGINVQYRGLFAIQTTTASAVLMSDGVMFAPLTSCAWQRDPAASADAIGRPTTTSASYVTLWRSYLPCTSGGIKTKFVAAPGAGNTMSVQITASIIGGAAQTVFSQTGITVTTDIDSSWAIPDAVLSPAADPVGSLLVLTIDALRSAGAGAVTAAPYLPVVNWVA